MKLMFSSRSSAQRRALSLLLPAACIVAAQTAAAQEPARSPGSSSSSSQWSTAPTSSSGSDVGSRLLPSGSPAASGDVDARVAALENKLAELQEKNEKRDKKLDWLEHVKISGYLQPQLLWQSYNDAASPNNGAATGVSGLPAGISANNTVAKADGTTTNGDYFRLRRARLKVELMPTDYAKFVMEIDPNLTGGTVGGTGTVARNVEAVGIANWAKDIRTEFAVGIFKIPFGYEVLQSDADRPFIERSWSEQNLTPGEFDTGARAYTTAFDKKLTFNVAVVNGTVQGEKNFALLPDLNRGKDVVGRLNYNFGPFDVGASGMAGSGSVVDAANLKVKQYNRWAVNFEAGIHYPLIKALGMTKVFSELTLAQNYDRGTKYAAGVGQPAIPTNINDDVVNKDERGFWVRIEQDFTEWATLGLRYDMYTPDSAQKNDARDTYGVVGVVHFTKGLQLMVEYDHAIDNVHKPGAAAPSKQLETVSSVFQVRY